MRTGSSPVGRTIERTIMLEAKRTALKKLIKDHTARHTQTPEAALKSLADSGIYNEDGTLHPNYGGKQGK